MEKIRKSKKDKIKWIVTFGAIALCVILIASVFGKLGRMETSRELGVTEFQIATITVDGNVGESRQHLVSGMNKVEDVEITLEDNATVSYKVAFYDEDKEFISMTDSLSRDFESTDIATGAVYFRIEITPAQVDGQAVQLNAFNSLNYINQVKVVIAK